VYFTFISDAASKRMLTIGKHLMTILVKWYSSSWETHLRAKEHHLPYGVTQCYLPPDTGERAPVSRE